MRWSKGGSRAATSGGDVAGCPGPNDAAAIKALLQSLSQVRLAVSADLSAAAGALEDDRADIAADVIAGARGELAQLRAVVRPRESAPEPRVTQQLIVRPKHRLARALAGAAALAVTIAVVPHLAGDSSQPSEGASTSAAAPHIQLASSEFTVLSQRLLAADAAPATILAAERSWQAAVSSGLPAAATRVSTAAAVVTMLQQEGALLLASPALRTPANRSLATALAANSESLLARLRQLADSQVLAILPTVLKALPTPAPSATAPEAGSTPAPVTSAAPSGPTPGTGTGTGSLPAPTTPGTNPSAPPSAPVSNPPLQVPLPDPGNPLPVPLPSTLGQLTGAGSGAANLGQTVGSVLNGLGLGG